MATKSKKKGKRRRKKKSSRAKLSPWQTIAIYGDSGVGKTSLAATSPKPLFLDSNFGMLSVDGMEDFSHVRRIPVSGMNHLDLAYDNLTGTGTKNWKNFRTIVFDHFDDIQGLVLDELTEAAVERDPRKMLDETSQRDWGIMGNRLRRYLRKIKSIPMHKVLIFATGIDKETGKACPQLQGQLRNQLPYFTDHIGYYRVIGKGKRAIFFEPTEDYVAKTRAWWLPKKKFLIPPPQKDPQFLTKFFESVAAGPRKSNRRGRKG